LEFLKGAFQHAFGVGQHLVVPEAEHPEALSLQPSGALDVVLPACGRVLLTAVDLDRKFVFEGDEIDDVGADGGFLSELGSAELTGAKLLPKALLGPGGRTP